jgi:excisionase family DNA binding protein
VTDGRPQGRLPVLLTVGELACILKLSIRSVRRLIADEKLRTVRIGSAVRIREDVLLALIEAGVI